VATQAWKTRVASAIVGDDNRSMVSMATGDLLDLLTLNRDGEATASKKRKSDVAGGQIDLDKVWSDTLSETDVYEADFDVGAFLRSINQ